MTRPDHIERAGMAHRQARYLALVAWARRRYRTHALAPGGRQVTELVTHRRGEPTRYTRIERAAWRRYLA